MKRYTTKFLKTVALVYLASPIFYIVALALVFDIPGDMCGRILLSPTYYLICLSAAVSGFGLWEMRRWAWYAFLFSNVLVVYQNAIYLHDFSGSHHKGAAFALSVLLIAAVIYRLAREVRVPYFFPRIRWWESNPRYKLSVPVQYKLGEQAEAQGEILDLSMGGCFIKLRAELKEDDAIHLVFNVFGHQIHCSGVVVWRTASTVTRPRGVGIKFGLLDRAQRRSLKMVNRRLRKIAAFYRRSRYLLNQDEFIKKLEELESQPMENRART